MYYCINSFEIFVVLIFGLYITQFVSSSEKNGGPTIIKAGGHRHRLDDIIIISGKGCKTPTIVKRGRFKLMHKGKTIIIIEAECKPKEESKKILEEVPYYMPHYDHNLDLLDHQMLEMYDMHDNYGLHDDSNIKGMPNIHNTQDLNEKVQDSFTPMFGQSKDTDISDIHKPTEFHDNSDITESPYTQNSYAPTEPTHQSDVHQTTDAIHADDYENKLVSDLYRIRNEANSKYITVSPDINHDYKGSQKSEKSVEPDDSNTQQAQQWVSNVVHNKH